MKFTKPAQLNGETLIKELAEVGIKIDSVFIDENGELDLKVKTKDKSKVEEVLARHDGSDTIPAEVLLKKSAVDKLIALGLTEDEAKAFLG